MVDRLVTNRAQHGNKVAFIATSFSASEPDAYGPRRAEYTFGCLTMNSSFNTDLPGRRHL